MTAEVDESKVLRTLRSVLLANHEKGGLELPDINPEYKALRGEDVPYHELNYHSLDSLLRAHPNMFQFKRGLWAGVNAEDTKNALALIEMSMSSKKKPSGPSRGGGGRSGTRGGRRGGYGAAFYDSNPKAASNGARNVTGAGNNRRSPPNQQMQNNGPHYAKLTPLNGSGGGGGGTGFGGSGSYPYDYGQQHPHPGQNGGQYDDRSFNGYATNAPNGYNNNQSQQPPQNNHYYDNQDDYNYRDYPGTDSRRDDRYDTNGVNENDGYYRQNEMDYQQQQQQRPREQFADYRGGGYLEEENRGGAAGRYRENSSGVPPPPRSNGGSSLFSGDRPPDMVSDGDEDDEDFAPPGLVAGSGFRPPSVRSGPPPGLDPRQTPRLPPGLANVASDGPIPAPLSGLGLKAKFGVISSGATTSSAFSKVSRPPSVFDINMTTRTVSPVPSTISSAANEGPLSFKDVVPIALTILVDHWPHPMTEYQLQQRLLEHPSLSSIRDDLQAGDNVVKVIKKANKDRQRIYICFDDDNVRQLAYIPSMPEEPELDDQLYKMMCRLLSVSSKHMGMDELVVRLGVKKVGEQDPKTRLWMISMERKHEGLLGTVGSMKDMKLFINPEMHDKIPEYRLPTPMECAVPTPPPSVSSVLAPPPARLGASSGRAPQPTPPPHLSPPSTSNPTPTSTLIHARESSLDSSVNDLSFARSIMGGGGASAPSEIEEPRRAVSESGQSSRSDDYPRIYPEIRRPLGYNKHPLLSANVEDLPEIPVTVTFFADLMNFAVQAKRDEVRYANLVSDMRRQYDRIPESMSIVPTRDEMVCVWYRDAFYRALTVETGRHKVRVELVDVGMLVSVISTNVFPLSNDLLKEPKLAVFCTAGQFYPVDESSERLLREDEAVISDSVVNKAEADARIRVRRIHDNQLEVFSLNFIYRDQECSIPLELERDGYIRFY